MAERDDSLTPQKVNDVVQAMLTNPSCRATYHREPRGRILILTVGEFDDLAFNIEGTIKRRVVRPFRS